MVHLLSPGVCCCGGGGECVTGFTIKIASGDILVAKDLVHEVPADYEFTIPSTAMPGLNENCVGTVTVDQYSSPQTVTVSGTWATADSMTSGTDSFVVPFTPVKNDGDQETVTMNFGSMDRSCEITFKRCESTCALASFSIDADLASGRKSGLIIGYSKFATISNWKTGIPSFVGDVLVQNDLIKFTPSSSFAFRWPNNNTFSFNMDPGIGVPQTFTLTDNNGNTLSTTVQRISPGWRNIVFDADGGTAGCQALVQPGQLVKTVSDMTVSVDTDKATSAISIGSAVKGDATSSSSHVAHEEMTGPIDAGPFTARFIRTITESQAGQQLDLDRNGVTSSQSGSTYSRAWDRCDIGGIYATWNPRRRFGTAARPNDTTVIANNSITVVPPS